MDDNHCGDGESAGRLRSAGCLLNGLQCIYYLFTCLCAQVLVLFYCISMSAGVAGGLCSPHSWPASYMGRGGAVGVMRQGIVIDIILTL